ncbi:MAG: chemotaxis protein CheX [Pirellulaceae bacterium]|nr:chemotaxis protein CheX [Pirellulaceae bacterium]
MNETLVSDDQMLELLESVWSSMLYVPISAVPPKGDFTEHARLTASVHIAGDWNGTVLLHLTEPFAEFAAATMLASDTEGLTDADRDDAAAELCNIIGGSIKSLLPGRNSLSLPAIVKGEESLLRVPNTHVLATMDVQSAGQPLRIRILARTDRKPAESEFRQVASAGAAPAGNSRSH